MSMYVPPLTRRYSVPSQICASGLDEEPPTYDYDARPREVQSRQGENDPPSFPRIDAPVRDAWPGFKQTARDHSDDSKP